MAAYPFLTFNGNCIAAMKFYQSCFGGELLLDYLGESPCGIDMPQDMKRLIMRGILDAKTIKIFASDLGGEEGLVTGNTIAILFKASGREELTKVYRTLSKGTMSSHALTDDFSKGQMISLADQFGINWLIFY